MVTYEHTFIVRHMNNLLFRKNQLEKEKFRINLTTMVEKSLNFFNLFAAFYHIQVFQNFEIFINWFCFTLLYPFKELFKIFVYIYACFEQ